MASLVLVFGAALMAGVASAASIGVEPRQMVTKDCADVHMFLAKGNDEPSVVRFVNGCVKVLTVEI
jgi:hypothetical protein